MNKERKTKLDNFKKNAINRFFTPGSVLIFKRSHLAGNSVHFESVLPQNKILAIAPRGDGNNPENVTTCIVRQFEKIKTIGSRHRKFQWLRRKKYITKINCKYRKLFRKPYEYYSLTVVKVHFGSIMVVLDRPQKVHAKNVEQYVVPVLYNEKIIYMRLSSRNNPRIFWKKMETKR